MKLRWLSVWFSFVSLWVVGTAGNSIAQPVYQRSITIGGLYSISSQAVLADNSVVFAGYLDSSFFRNKRDGIVFKIDRNGSLQWAITLSGPPPFTMVDLNWIVALPDGSLTMIASLNDGAFIQKTALIHLSSMGEVRWAQSYDLTLPSIPDMFCHTRDGGYCLIGLLSDSISPNIFRNETYLLKTDSLGSPLWCYRAQFTKTDYTLYYRLIEGKDSLLTAVGVTFKVPFSPFLKRTELLCFLQLHADGTLKRQIVWHSADHDLEPKTLIQASDGEIIIGGTVIASPGVNAGMLLKVGEPILPVWSSTYSFFANALIWSLVTQPDNTIIALSAPGDTDLSNASLCIVNEAGTMLSAFELQKRPAFYGQLSALEDHSGYVVATSVVSDSLTPSHLDISTVTPALQGCSVTPILGVVRELPLEDTSLASIYEQWNVSRDTFACSVTQIPLDTATICQEIVNMVTSMQGQQQFQVYPNPVPAGTPITISCDKPGHYEILLRDLSGRELYRTSSTTAEIRIPTASLSAGIYYIEVLKAGTQQQVWNGKVVVE